jgi:hypothetical protein
VDHLVLFWAGMRALSLLFAVLGPRVAGRDPAVGREVG